jgi:predicted dehydrogenase
VLVATPDHLHRDAAVAAAEAGKHVLIEKPLATTVADARAIRDAAEANGVVAMTLFNHRFVPSYWQAKQQIDERGLGPLRLAYARKNDVRSVPLSMIGWADSTTPAWFLSSHDLDLLLWYAGEQVESVYASAVTGTLSALGVDTPDAVQAQLRFIGGAVATVEACWSYPNTFPTMTDSFMELVLQDGVIHLDRKHEQIEVADLERFSYPRNTLVNHVAGKPAGSTAAAVEHFVDCVLDGRSPAVDIASSVHVTEVLAAIHRSCHSGQPVPLKESCE